METFELEAYLTGGVERIVRDILRAALGHPSAGRFMAQYALENRKASEKRRKSALAGTHIPPFLIASITTRCNLHCKGCYARTNHICADGGDAPRQLTAGQWADIFRQAAELGVSFILLAGGEPFLRTDVLQEAGKCRKLLFPVFTNGTLLDDACLALVAKNRNLLPILSIEGARETTDERRGEGVFRRLRDTMGALHRQNILFGTSVTVHRENLEEVLGAPFLDPLAAAGCKAVIYVEYVPVDHRTESLALTDADRQGMLARVDALRRDRPELIFIAFPGDEKRSGGCLAAGRGFFHINPFGGAEPCPFSPYSDTSLADVTLAEALESPLFTALHREGTLLEAHSGGCVLFAREEKVKECLGR